MTNPLPESARRRLQMPVAEAHPDAGLLTAFAEQSLTAAERDRVLHHLAACATCREIVALAAPETLPTEVPVAVTRPWFRWSALHWVALAATAVIVWAAVSVLAPRTANHDVSAPAQSAIRIAPPATLHSQLKSKVEAESQIPAAPAVMARAKKAAPVRQSQPATQQLAQVEQEPQRDALDSTKDNSILSKEDAGVAADAVKIAGATAVQPAAAGAPGPLVANKIAPPAPPPAPQQTDEAKLENAPMSGAPGAVMGGARVNAKSQLPSATFPPTTGPVGGPVAADGIRANFAKRTELPIIAGTITDPSGAVVPDALVRITNSKANTSTALRTDSAGTYRTPVNPGVYSVEATFPGMQPETAENFTVNGPVARNFRLRLAPLAGPVEVTVQAEAAPAAPMPAQRQSVKQEAQNSSVDAMARAKTIYAYDLSAARRWRVSPDGTLEQSTDGTTWKKPAAAPTAVFRVVFAHGSEVWAGGENGALFHSTDGGRTWSRVLVAAAKSPVTDTITGLSFSSALGSVSTSSGDIWLTADGGRTWNRR